MIHDIRENYEISFTGRHVWLDQELKKLCK